MQVVNYSTRCTRYMDTLSRSRAYMNSTALIDSSAYDNMQYNKFKKVFAAIYHTDTFFTDAIQPHPEVAALMNAELPTNDTEPIYMGYFRIG